MENKHDLSMSMARVNVIMLILSMPLFIVQFAVFVQTQDVRDISLTFNLPLLLIAIILGVATHEIIHGFSWMIFGRKSLSVVKFGFQWKTLTPYAYLQEP